MARRDTLPDWLSDELILGQLTERELRERSLLVEKEELPVPPLTLKKFVHEFWDVPEPGTPMAWGLALTQCACTCTCTWRPPPDQVLHTLYPGRQTASRYSGSASISHKIASMVIGLKSARIPFLAAYVSPIT
ncbi:hypothetical protein [Deinococcus sp. UYEF24]